LLHQIIIKLFNKHDPRKKSKDYRSNVKNAFFNSAETILYPILWLIATPFFVTYLGTEQYGIWMLVNGLMGFGGGVLGLGLADATIKFVSKYNSLKNGKRVTDVIRTTMTIYGILGIIVGVIIIWIAPFLVNNIFRVNVDNYDLTIIAFQIAGIGIIMRFFNDIYRSVIYAFERHDINARVTMIIDVLTMGINVFLVVIGFDLFAVLITTVITLGLGGVVKAYICKSVLVKNLSFTPLLNKGILKEVFSYSIYTWLQSMMRLVQTKLDRFIVAGMVSVSALTYYVIALKVAEIIHSVLARGSSFIFPMVSKIIEKNDYENLKEIYNKSSVIIVILSSAIVIPTYIFGYSILELWMGSDFALETFLILYIFLAKYMFHPLGIINHHFLLGTGLVKLNVQFLAITAPLVIILMVIMIPFFGLKGAALAHLISIPSVMILRLISEKLIFDEYKVKLNLLYLIPPIILYILSTFIVINLNIEIINIWNIIPLYLSVMIVCLLTSLSIFKLLNNYKYLNFKL
jgi:O-antigen/teichoic acid export membrane protein